MSNPRKQWLLKVIAGPHQGAEVILDAGKALVGSDDDCDVVLHDVLVAPQHLALELADNGIVAAPLGGRVFYNGKRIKEARQTIAEFSFLTIGGTHLVVGPAEGKWPLLSSADVPDLEKEAPVPEKVEVENKEASAPVETSPVAETPVSDGRPSKEVRRGAWINVALGCLMLIGSLVAWKIWVSPLLPAPSVAHVSTEKETELDRANKIIKEIGAENSIKIEEQAGRLTATGYVETDSKQREIQTALRSAMPGMRARIWSLEKIASSARNFLIAQRLPLTVSSLPEGELTIGGTLATSEEWDRARQMLLTEIPGISGIDDKVQIGIQPSGIKSNPEVPRNAAGISPVTASTLPSTEATPVLPKPAPAEVVNLSESTIATINVREDDLGWVKLSDGGIYFLGGKFPSGALLVDITEQSVSVLDQGQKRELRLGEKISRSLAESPTSSHTLVP